MDRTKVIYLIHDAVKRKTMKDIDDIDREIMEINKDDKLDEEIKNLKLNNLLEKKKEIEKNFKDITNVILDVTRVVFPDIIDVFEILKEVLSILSDIRDSLNKILEGGGNDDKNNDK